MWRLDTDSFLLGEAAAGPFAQMDAAGATYISPRSPLDLPNISTISPLRPDGGGGRGAMTLT